MRQSAKALSQPCLRASRKEVARGALAEVVVVAVSLERGVDVLGILVGPVRQQQHVIAIGGVTFTSTPVDDESAIQAHLFLEAGMRVVPVGAVLVHLVAIGERGARCNAIE